MPDNIIAEMLQRISKEIAQIKVIVNNVQDDVRHLREEQARQAGEIEATQQQSAINKKKLGASLTRS